MTRLAAVLIRWFPALALLGPCVILATIYMGAVEPKLAAEQSARAQADGLRAQLLRLRKGNAAIRDAVAPPALPPQKPIEDDVPAVAEEAVPRPAVAVAARVVRAVAVTEAQPEPVVHTILYSSQNRSALVDRRIVRPGDRVAFGLVIAIEPDAVVFDTDAGLVRRLFLERVATKAVKR